jgi:BCD family chlorophyll transporter-like MFS transporter
MYVMLLMGMIVSALLFGALLADFSPGRLIEVIQGAAVATLVLNVTALWKQEGRHRSTQPYRQDPSFKESWATFTSGNDAVRRLIAVGLGTMAFSMEDVLLEPYGGEILHLSVAATTALTATLALGGLSGFALASNVLSRGMDPFKMASIGAQVGVPAFVAVICSDSLGSPALFSLGVFLIGFGGGLFGHGTLTATMNLAPREQSGLALGAWGAVQATAAGLAIALGGVIRDVVATQTASATAYAVVYGIEICLLLGTMYAMSPLIRRPALRQVTV